MGNEQIYDCKWDFQSHAIKLGHIFKIFKVWQFWIWHAKEVPHILLCLVGLDVHHLADVFGRCNLTQPSNHTEAEWAATPCFLAAEYGMSRYMPVTPYFRVFCRL